MAYNRDKKYELREKRKMRVRRKLHGTASKPRLCVVKSNAHIHAQLIDDDNHSTIAALSTNGKELRGTDFTRSNKTSAREIGRRLAEAAKSKNIDSAIFDRGYSKFHGVLKELADAAKEAGLNI
jgi:large subunit ribosomal protein L18